MTRDNRERRFEGVQLVISAHYGWVKGEDQEQKLFLSRTRDNRERRFEGVQVVISAPDGWVKGERCLASRGGAYTEGIWTK